MARREGDCKKQECSQSAVTYTTHQGRHTIETMIRGMDLPLRLFIFSNIGQLCVSVCLSACVCYNRYRRS